MGCPNYHMFGRYKDILRTSTSLKRAPLLAVVGAIALSCAANVFSAVLPAQAQSLTSGDLTSADIDQNARLLLVADALTYNQDLDLITAEGGVRIDYGDYQLVAQKVEYDQANGRVRAIGQVELIEPNGNRFLADELDVTDNFSDGFARALRVQTASDALITAQTAERRGGKTTILRNGTYDACPQCLSQGNIASQWKVRVRRIVRNAQTKTIRIEAPVITLNEKPVLKLPSMTLPELATERQSGFLAPSIGYADKFGVKARVPYYFALSPHMDATMAASGFSKTGFMTELEFRQKFRNGSYQITLAGAQQTNPGQFDQFAGHATTDGAQTQRGLIASKGEFQLNDRWKFGWNGMLQSDSNFANTYNIEGYSSSTFTNQIYLTGLGTTSFFNLSSYKFDVQSDVIGDISQDQQASVYPVIDYSRIFTLGDQHGDLKLTANGQYLSRDLQDVQSGRTLGVDGQNGRASTELEWRKQIVTQSGLVVTPLLALRGDYHTFNANNVPTGLTSGTNASRGMATAGLEVKYPILATTGTSSHIFEPIAQIFARNDEQLSGGLPNEDAQSFVFDATNLFERDKFSGFDRIEGGTRANLGLRYTGTSSNGLTTSAIFGQSFHLAGKNSFAETDLTGAGADSGLETDRSDYVGAVTIADNSGLSVTSSARFDKDDFQLNRSDLSATFNNGILNTQLSHSFIRAQDGYGSTENREEISAYGAYRLNDDWTIGGGTVYDLDDKQFSTSAADLTFENNFSRLKTRFEHTHATASDAANWSVEFNWTFKSFGQLQFDELILEE